MCTETHVGLHINHHHHYLLTYLLTAIKFSLGGRSTNKNKYTEMIQYKNTVQTIQSTINKSTHIMKTPTQLSKHHTLQNPHIHTPTHYKTS
jgi:hypothetical protein